MIAPLTAGFQGPALITYNDAVFTDRDFESIQHVGASRKAESEGRAKTGRFGVGFNSCYHATDLPSFLSRQFLVVFDPHCTHLPNASPHDPGKIIDFSTEGLAAQFPDTFAPYHVFGCETAAGTPFAGTIFRLPLRTAEQAAASRITKRAFAVDAARALLKDFVAALPELCLFLTHIRSVEVSTWEAGEAAPQRLCALDTRDAASGGAPKRQPLAQHVAAARDDLRALPQTQSSVRLQVDVAAEGASRRAVWLVAESLGGGRAREMCGDELVLAHGLQPLPWAGVAARLHGGDTAVSGRPYCLLPLPTETGLPVHINGFFEISSNRHCFTY